MANYIGEITKYSLEREVIYTTNSTYTINSTGVITICSYSLVPYCSYGRHDHSNGIDSECRGLEYTTVESCASFFSGGSFGTGTIGSGNNPGSGDGDGNNNGGGPSTTNPCAGSGGTTGTVIVGTQPISGIGSGCTPNETVVVSLQPEDPPCVSLTKLFDTNRENIKSKINNYLKPKLNEPFEYAVNYRKYTRPEEEFFSQNEQPISKTASIIQIGGNFYGQIHTHPVGTYPMFSWQDINNLKDLYADAKPQNKQDVFMIIVCPNDKVYAVKVDDITKLETKMGGDWDSPELIGCTEEEKNKEILDMMKEVYSKDSNSEKVFLKKFKDYGISVYKADSNLTNWSKLSLDNPNSENPTVNQNPCNQN